VVVLTAFSIARFLYRVPIPIEWAIVFPMALIPNIGAWNMLYLALGPRHHLPLGFHGAILPLILAPLGALLATLLGFLTPVEDGFLWFHAVRVAYVHCALVFPLVLMAYYLVWKYLVGFLNGMLGIAA
jgi:hypothetical protein